MASNSYNGGGDKKLTSGSGTSAVISEFETERNLVDASVNALENVNAVTWVNNAVIAANANFVQPIFVAPVDCTLVGVRFVDADGVPADGSNSIEISVVNKGQAGVGTLPLATFNSDSGGANDAMTALVAFVIDLDPAADIDAGDVLTLQTLNTGTGQALEEFMCQLLVKPRSIA